MSDIPDINTALLHMATKLTAAQADKAKAAAAGSSSTSEAVGGGDAATMSSGLPRRDPKDLEWLRQAMASIEQPEQTLKRLLAVIDELGAGIAPPPVDSSKPRTKADDKPKPTLLEALSELAEMVEDINFAKEYLLMKGPARTLHVLRTVNSRIAAAASSSSSPATGGASSSTRPPPSGGDDDDVAVESDHDVVEALWRVIGNASQNNEELQGAFGGWESLCVEALSLATSGSEDDAGAAAAAAVVTGTAGTYLAAGNLHVLNAILYAACSLCRDHPAASAAFIAKGGLAVALQLCATANHRTEPRLAKPVARGLRLLSYLADQGFTSQAALFLATTMVEDESDIVSDAAICFLHRATTRLLPPNVATPTMADVALSLAERLDAFARRSVMLPGGVAALADEHRELVKNVRLLRGVVASGATEAPSTTSSSGVAAAGAASGVDVAAAALPHHTAVSAAAGPAAAAPAGAEAVGPRIAGLLA